MTRPRFSALSLLLILAACSGNDVRETIGLERSAPDEFKVVSRPPLSVPPEFSLRPPLPGEEEVAALPSGEIARSMITGTTATYENATPTKADGSPVVDTAVLPVESGSAPTGAESELLTKLGADRKESDIRDKIVEEHVEKQKEKEDEWFSVDALNPFAKDKDVVDAKEEVKKLDEEGKPVIGRHLIQDEKAKEEGKPEEKSEEQKPAEETSKPETKPEEPKTEAPVVEAPVVEAPVVEAPKAEEKKAEDPKPDLSKASTEVKEEPKKEEPKQVTLKDVIEEKQKEKEESASVRVSDKVNAETHDGSLINLDMPDLPNDSFDAPAETEEAPKAPEAAPAEAKTEAPVKAETPKTEEVKAKEQKPEHKASAKTHEHKEKPASEKPSAPGGENKFPLKIIKK